MECACGCGAKVRLGRGGINKNLRRTVEVLEKLQEARQHVLVQPQPPAGEADPILGLLDDRIAEGQAARQWWTWGVHGERAEAPGGLVNAQRQWMSWITDSESLADFALAPPETKQQLIATWNADGS